MGEALASLRLGMLFSIVKDYFGDVVNVSPDAENLSFFKPGSNTAGGDRQ
jgi:hypothetical protein